MHHFSRFLSGTPSKSMKNCQIHSGPCTTSFTAAGAASAVDLGVTDGRSSRLTKPTLDWHDWWCQLCLGRKLVRFWNNLWYFFWVDQSAPLWRGISLKCPIWGGSNKQQMYGKCEGFPFSKQMHCLGWCLINDPCWMIPVIHGLLSPWKKLTYPTLGKGTTSSKVPAGRGYVSSLKGRFPLKYVYIYIYIYIYILLFFLTRNTGTYIYLEPQWPLFFMVNFPQSNT